MAETAYTMRLELAERRRMLMKALARRPAGKESRLFQTLSSSSSVMPVSEEEQENDISKKGVVSSIAFGCGERRDLEGVVDSITIGDCQIDSKVRETTKPPFCTTTKKADSCSWSPEKFRATNFGDVNFRLPVPSTSWAPPLLTRSSDSSSEDSVRMPLAICKDRAKSTTRNRWGDKCDPTLNDHREVDSFCSDPFKIPLVRPVAPQQSYITSTHTEDAHHHNTRLKPMFTPSLSDIIRRDPPSTMDESIGGSSNTMTDRQMADLRKARLKRFPNRPPMGHNQRLFLETRIQSKQRTTLIVGSPTRRQTLARKALYYDTDDEREDVPTESVARARTGSTATHPSTGLVSARNSSLEGSHNSHDENNLGSVQQFFQSLLTASDDLMPSDEDPKSFDSEEIEPHPSMEESQSVGHNEAGCLESVDESVLLESGDESNKNSEFSPALNEHTNEKVVDLDLVIDMSKSSLSCTCKSSNISNEKLPKNSKESNYEIIDTSLEGNAGPPPMEEKPTKVYRFYEPEASWTLRLLFGSFMEQDDDVDSIKSLDGKNTKLSSPLAEYQKEDPTGQPGPSRVEEKLQAIIQGKPAWKSISEQCNTALRAPQTATNNDSRLSILEALSLSSGGTSSGGGIINNDDLIRTLSSGSDSIAASFEVLIADLQGLLSETPKEPLLQEDREIKGMGGSLVRNESIAGAAPSSEAKFQSSNVVLGAEIPTNDVASLDQSLVEPPSNEKGLVNNKRLSTEPSSVLTNSTKTPSFDRKRITVPVASESEEVPSLDQSDDFASDSSHDFAMTGSPRKSKPLLTSILTKKAALLGVGSKANGAEESETPLVSNAKRFSFTEDEVSSQECTQMQESSAKTYDQDVDDVEHLERTLTQIKAMLAKTERMKKIITVSMEKEHPPPTKVVSFTPKSQRGAIEVEFLPQNVDKILSTTNESLERLSFERMTMSRSEPGCNLTVTSSLTENTADDDYEDDEDDDDDDISSSSSSSSSTSSGDDTSNSSDEEVGSTVPSEILTKNSILQSCSMDPQSVLANVESNDENYVLNVHTEVSSVKKLGENSKERNRHTLILPSHEKRDSTNSCPRALTEITAAILCRCTGPVHSPRGEESFDVTGREIVVLESHDRISQLV
jgi:hypothetical protein